MDTSLSLKATKNGIQDRFKLDGRITGQLDIWMSDICFEVVENQAFDILTFEINLPTESKYQKSTYNETLGRKDFINGTSSKTLNKIPFAVKIRKSVYDEAQCLKYNYFG